MAFGLGVAIANLFARIAAALNSSGPQAISPLPPSPPSSPQPTPTPPSGSPVPIPEPPYVPPVAEIPFVPPVVTVPPSPPVIVDGDDEEPCSPLSLSDRLALYGLQQRSSQQSTLVPLSPQILVPEVVDMPNSTSTGHLIEATDVFRFRAFSTSDVVSVSFFGRVMSQNGSITPFNHTLRTLVPGTIYETIVPAGRGMLLGAAASVPVNSITTGTVSAVGEIGRNLTGSFVPHTLLFSGQLDDLTPLTASSASVSAPVGKGTFIRVDFPGIAAPDNSVVVTPNTGRQLRILYVSGDYVCSGTAGNRQLTISFAPEGEIMWRGMASQYITASQTGVYRFTMGGQFESPTTALPGSFRQISCPLPESLWFPVAVTVTKSAYGIQAGDTVGGGSVLYEEQ